MKTLSMKTFVVYLKNALKRATSSFFGTPENRLIRPFKAIIGAVVLTAAFALLFPLIVVLFILQAGLALTGMIAIRIMRSRHYATTRAHKKALLISHTQ